MIGSFADISEVEPLAEDDCACLREVRDVLARHGKLDRLGVTLLHSHFPVAEDEVLLESCDPESRTLTIRPVLKSQLESSQTIETNWCLKEGVGFLVCMQACGKDPKTGAHVPLHTYVR